MSKLEFIHYAKSLLTAASTNLKSQTPPDNIAAGRLDTIARTAEYVSDGYWLRIGPLYFTPKLQLAVRDLNNAIIAGQHVPDFDTYISTLVENLAA